MNVIIPCSGLGTRFKKEGFITPKPLIRCMMKPFICWILDTLKKSKVGCEVFITVVSDPNYDKMYQHVASQYENVTMVYLDDPTRGACDTVAKTIEKMPLGRMDSKTLCLDCDNFYNVDVLALCADADNSVLTFIDDDPENTQPKYSFVTVDDDDCVTDIAEKVRISRHALCGAYCFESGHDLYNCATSALSSFEPTYNEVYMSCAVKAGMRAGISFRKISVPNDDYVCVGTPSQMYSFYNNISVIPIRDAYGGMRVEKKRVCFDLDETLVSKPVVDGDYSTCLPIQKNIDLCNYLKRMNNHIIIHTARRMKTHGGNVGAIIADVGKVTIDTLQRFGVLYDELLFGKPYADVYIDDKAVDSNGDLEKQLGVYNAIGFETRSFNNVTTDSFPVVKKTAHPGAIKDIRSEIYYYKNIPNTVKDMFPLFVDHGEDQYRIEKIHGRTLSDLYVSGELTKDMIIAVVNSLRRLHESPTNPGESYSRTFYKDKLFERSKHDVYSAVEAKETASTYAEYFDEYRFDAKNIHGDPVLTNVMVNNFDKLKFIDMRGNFGDGHSLLGDPLYDFAKVYQSLCGYDFVLKNIPVNEDVVRECAEAFEALFDSETMEKIKVITKYLLYTMLPMHAERDHAVLRKFLEIL